MTRSGQWMRVNSKTVGAAVALALVLWGIGPDAAHAQPETGAIRGMVVDQVGVRLPAHVMLLREGRVVTETDTDASGGFVFRGLAPGRYHMEAHAPGFRMQMSGPIIVGSDEAAVVVSLSVGPFEQHVVVTADAVPTTRARTGAPVTVVDRVALDALRVPYLFGALRAVPGVHALQTGQRGGIASLFVRGGASDFQKVLIDGVPASDIGGAFDFAGVPTAGVDRIEVLRTANSVQHGADALSGVINVATRRGQTETPEVSYSIDGGTHGTFMQELAVGGLADRVDYFFDVARFQTRNDLPNNEFRNTAFAGQAGFLLGSATDLRVTVRRIRSDLGVPGAVLFNGLADDSSQESALTVVGITADSQLTDRLRATIRVAANDQRTRFVNPAPTGTPFDPFGFGANYLGDPVTISGANGFSTSGRAVLDYGGVYPSVFTTETSRRFVSGQVDYRLTDGVDASAGLRFKHDSGGQRGSLSTASVTRTSTGGFVELRAAVGNRVYLTGGAGFDNSSLFGAAVTPRVSAAVYLRRPSPGYRLVGETKVTANAGRGIKAPVVFEELNGLHALLGNLPGGPALITGTGVAPIGPERSRSIDAGLEQGLWNNQVRARVAFFHNTFSSLIEYVNRAVLPDLGVPAAAAAALPFGATVNASAYRARGAEVATDVAIGESLQVAYSYLFLDAVVEASFLDGVLFPKFNPAFPAVAIGQYAPLVGARPFRRPTHSGHLSIRYDRGPMTAALLASFVGRSDDSTFLSDAFFGPSLLLPNRNLAGAYRVVDVSGSYAISPRVRWGVRVENLFDETYAAVPGYPAPPRTVRTGMTFTLGGLAAGAR